MDCYILEIIYKSYIRSIIQYGDIIMSNMNKQKNKIENQFTNEPA